MKSLTVFAHYDKDLLVDEYVILYLKELKRFTHFIIFVSDCDLPTSEQNKLHSLADVIIVGRHEEYDFGSYKRGYFYARENHLLDQYDELILCNDSCFAPVVPFDGMFENMRSKTLDFWGASINLYGLVRHQQEIHLQSYFLVFNRRVMQSNVLCEFMSGVTKQQTKEDVINKYEIGLTRRLEEAGYIFASQAKLYDSYAPHLGKWREFILDDGVPFLKVGLVRTMKLDFSYLSKIILYDMRLIISNTARHANEINAMARNNLSAVFDILKHAKETMFSWVLFGKKRNHYQNKLARRECRKRNLKLLDVCGKSSR